MSLADKCFCKEPDKCEKCNGESLEPTESGKFLALRLKELGKTIVNELRSYKALDTTVPKIKKKTGRKPNPRTFLIKPGCEPEKMVRKESRKKGGNNGESEKED